MAPFDRGLTERFPLPAYDQPAPRHHVPESRFGVWFLDTWMWKDRVLRVALRDLQGLMARPHAHYPVVLDAGCGHGRSFAALKRAFRPRRIIGVDCDPKVLANARRRAAESGRMEVTVMEGSCADLPLAAASVDLIFCHQTFHHLVDQHGALSEFHRVLKPGGVLLFAESTRAYIETWIIRWFFRHPMEVQRSADEYLALLRSHGFVVAADAVSYPYLWWSRPDLGLLERIFGIAPPAPGHRDETLVNAVAIKPAPSFAPT